MIASHQCNLCVALVKENIIIIIIKKKNLLVRILLLEYLSAWENIILNLWIDEYYFILLTLPITLLKSW